MCVQHSEGTLGGSDTDTHEGVAVALQLHDAARHATHGDDVRADAHDGVGGGVQQRRQVAPPHARRRPRVQRTTRHVDVPSVPAVPPQRHVGVGYTRRGTAVRGGTSAAAARAVDRHGGHEGGVRQRDAVGAQHHPRALVLDAAASKEAALQRPPQGSHATSLPVHRPVALDQQVVQHNARAARRHTAAAAAATTVRC